MGQWDDIEALFAPIPEHLASQPAERTHLPDVPPPDVHVWSVRELTEALDTLLQERFHAIWVQGEVSNCKVWNERFMFFTIKDPDAQIEAIVFPEDRARLQVPLQDGQAYFFYGTVTFYGPRGVCRFRVRQVIPEGAGRLHLEFVRIRDALEREGLFASDRKRPLPAWIQTVGVVTSLDGAAVRDILKTLHNHGETGIVLEVLPPASGQELYTFCQAYGLTDGATTLRVILAHSQVQGEAAVPQLIRGLERLSQHPDVEVIIIGRGGGALEDLWAFNDPDLARRIRAVSEDCGKVVISAVGHEKDMTISDLVADLRASTPTQAAQLIVQQRRRRIDEWQVFCDRLDRSIHNCLLHKEHAYHQTGWTRAAQLIELRCNRWVQWIADLSVSLGERTRRRLQETEHTVHQLRQRLSPAQLYAKYTMHMERVRDLRVHLRHLIHQHLHARRNAWTQLDARCNLQRIHTAVRHAEETFRFWQDRLHRSAAHAWTVQWQTWQDVDRQLRHLRARLLDCRTPDGQPIRSVWDVRVGDRMDVILPDGRIRTTVDGVYPFEEARDDRSATPDI